MDLFGGNGDHFGCFQQRYNIAVNDVIQGY